MSVDALENTEHTEHTQAAQQAGLRYTTDSVRGISRERVGDEFVYIAANGLPITNERKLRRIRALAIPPAWTDVWICPDPRGHLQVTARDAKGRKQYRYHAKYRAVRDETKFNRMVDFSRVLPAAREHVEAHLRLRGLPREKVLASVVWLLEQTLIRVGNMEYAKENDTFGLTTMQDRHAKVDGTQVMFSFRGKSGKEHSVSVTDRRLARIIQRCQALPGQELFQYVDEEGVHRSVESGHVNEYLRSIAGVGVTAKDFRTWGGTMLAAELLREIGPARRVRDKEANIVKAVDQVAQRLGNTRTVCRKYYIHPVVLDAYRRGRVLPPMEQSDEMVRRNGKPGLRHHESEVMQFIQENQTNGKRRTR
jgi:DNA topoisomerase-1